MRPLRLCGETRDSARLIGETLEIHTHELGWYNPQESELATASREGLEIGREEGEIKGREEGELFGKMRMLQNLLSLPQSTDQELQPKARTELKTLATKLQAQLRKRMT